jgi:carboxyl-terminal processing protease
VDCCWVNDPWLFMRWPKERMISMSSIGMNIVISIFLLAAGFTLQTAAADPIKRDRDRARIMLKEVSKTIEREFFDGDLNGLDWERLKKEAEAGLEQAQSVGQMLTALHSLVKKLNDSHTTFVPPQRVSRVRYGYEAKAFGDEIRIYEIDKKGAAAQAGMQLGDRILTVNGFKAERATFDHMMLFFRVLQPMEAMEIGYLRDGHGPQTLRLQGHVKQGRMETDLTSLDTIYELIRESQNVKETFQAGVDAQGIGILSVPSFTSDKDFLHRLFGKIRKAKVVIVDLRGNRGGAVSGLKTMAGLFEKEPVLMADMVRRKKTEPLRVNAYSGALEVPMVILVDSESASASEVFAHHFQKNGRALVIGDRTSGSVSVGRYFSHKIGMDVVVFYGVQVTTAKLEFPGGIALEGAGVAPDILCIPSAKDLSEGSDPCLALAYKTAAERL